MNKFRQGIRSADSWLWASIALGLLFRFIYPSFDNPITHMDSDMHRHFANAQNLGTNSFFAAADPLGYELWLYLVLKLSGGQSSMIGWSAGFLSMLTPAAWWLWFREIMSERRALCAFALLTWLGDWVAYSAYFMEENLLFPLAGLTLWFCWRSLKYGLSTIPFSICAGLTFITKAVCLPMVSICWLLLLSRQPLKSLYADKKLLLNTAISAAVFLAICAINPIKFYLLTHSIVPFLPAYSEMNRQYLDSKAIAFEIDILWTDHTKGKRERIRCEFGQPSLGVAQFHPFSGWTTSRSGWTNIAYDADKPWPSIVSLVTPPALDVRIAHTLENAAYMLVGSCWPASVPEETPFDWERFCWPLVVAAVLYHSVRQKKFDNSVFLFVGTLAFLLIQQSYVSEGRFRMLWEAIAIGEIFACWPRLEVKD